jgi:glycosyltransferase 2 family protein
MRALRWKILLKPLGYPVTTKNSFLAVLIGYMVNFAVPRAGEISKCVIINRANKTPLNQVIGTVLIERIFDTICLLIILITVLFIEFNTLKDLVYDYIYFPLRQKYASINLMFIIILIVIILIAIFIAIYAIKFIKHKSKTNKFAEKIHNLLSGFYSGIKTIRTMEHKWKFAIYTILMWSAYWGVTYIVFFATKPLVGLTPLAGLSVLAISSVGMVFPSPGGIGSYHYAVIIALKFYKPINYADIDWHNASALYALLNHESQMIFLILAGAVAYLVFIISQRKAIISENA